MPLPAAAADAALRRLRRAGRALVAGAVLTSTAASAAEPEDSFTTLYARYAADGRSDVEIHLSTDGADDAAAVIAVFRQDGGEAAASLVMAMRPARIWAPSRAHETVAALNGALAFVRTTPQAVATPQAAFDAALEIGASVARRAVRDAPEAVLAAQQAALAQARAAFAHGRHANAAFTWRARDEQPSPSDVHVFLREGEARREPALGAEGAHALERLHAQPPPRTER